LLVEIRRTFERRLLWLRLLTLVAFLVLFGRLVQLQWIEHRRYALQAEKNRVHFVPVLPVRGKILDRAGHELATNRIAYRIVIVPENAAGKADRILQRIAELVGWDEERLRRLQRRVRRARPDRPVLLDDRLPWKVAARVAARLHEMPGVSVEAGTYRVYPEGELTAHLVGYLSLASSKDLRQGRLATEYVGRTGAERVFDALLRGKPGVREEEVDARGRRLRVLAETPPLNGEDIRLALDLAVQRAAAAALGNRAGAAVVLDVQTGEVIAWRSQPSYDPNLFVRGMRPDEWRSLRDDPLRPLLDRVHQAAYPPASTFKLVTALAALRAQLPLALGQTVCPGYVELADRKLRCWKRDGHGQVDLHRAIVVSCDVFFYELGDALGMARISEEAERWGFGERTGVALPGEQKGVIPARHPYLMPLLHLKLRGRRARWYRGETMIAAIGQGAITATPLQLARFAAAIANGGKLLVPQLRAGMPPKIERIVPVSPADLARIRRAMRDVVAAPEGTAHAAFLGIRWQVAGKTGTAQVVAEREDAPQREQPKDHAWFIGFVPYEAPRYAFAVFVEHGGHGGSAAAPVAAAIVRALEAQARRRGGNDA